MTDAWLYGPVLARRRRDAIASTSVKPSVKITMK